FIVSCFSWLESNPVRVLFKVRVYVKFALRGREVNMSWCSLCFACGMEFRDVIIWSATREVEPALVFIDKFLSSFLIHCFSEVFLRQAGRYYRKGLQSRADTHSIKCFVGSTNRTVGLRKSFGVDQKYFRIPDDRRVLG